MCCNREALWYSSLNKVFLSHIRLVALLIQSYPGYPGTQVPHHCSVCPKAPPPLCSWGWGAGMLTVLRICSRVAHSTWAHIPLRELSRVAVFWLTGEHAVAIALEEQPLQLAQWTGVRRKRLITFLNFTFFFWSGLNFFIDLLLQRRESCGSGLTTVLIS